MSADDRLKVIARHLGVGKNVFNTSMAMQLCSSENKSSDTAQGGVVLPQIGPSSDARKTRSKPVKSAIPKNRYEFLPSICVGLLSILFCKFVISFRKAFNCNFIFFYVRLTRVPSQSYIMNGV
jgi:hypothetical protein